ncbi:hypothetical protein ACLOJK_034476, partial [Asimina triloba]
ARRYRLEGHRRCWTAWLPSFALVGTSRGCCLLSTGYRPPSVEWVVTVWISPTVDNGRIRSVDRSLAGVGSDGGLLGKMEYRNSVLR